MKTLNIILNKIKYLSEQEPDEDVETSIKKDVNIKSDISDVKVADTGMDEIEPDNRANDVGMGNTVPDTGMDMGLGPMEEPQAATTSTEIGRVYEMKKIFSRLTSIESFLSSTNDVEMLRLRDYVIKSIELFEVLMSNLKLFLDRIDEIIVTYYKFILTIYNMIEKYHNRKHDEKIKNRGGSTGY